MAAPQLFLIGRLKEVPGVLVKEGVPSHDVHTGSGRAGTGHVQCMDLFQVSLIAPTYHKHTCTFCGCMYAIRAVPSATF